jgi:16S rRNA (guanine527-N7)-methyltransferase
MALQAWQAIVPTLSDDQVKRLDRFLDHLIEWNQKLNLTRIVNRGDAELKHIADALTAVPHIGHARTLADVGTGGGVPGVPIAIARPDLQVTLIDSTRKKLDAIDQIVRAVGLSNVRVVHSRIEAVEQTFDVITARAVAEMNTLLGWCDRLMHDRSLLIAMKGPRADEELAAVPARMRARFSIDRHAVSTPGLEGHQLLLVRPIRQRSTQRGPT